MESAAPGRTIQLVGERCRMLRARLGLSREALALRSEGADSLSLATIKRAELGQPVYPGSASALARLLGARLDELLPGGETPRAKTGHASVAVRPFRTSDEGLHAAQFAFGLAADLIHRLATFWFPVIARGSSFGMGDDTTHEEIGHALGADYLVEGSVRVLDARVRIIAALVRAADGRQVWTHKYERKLSDVLTAQAELAADIGSQIGGKLLDLEGARVAATDLHDLDAWALGLRSAWHLHRLNRDDNLEARTCAESAIAREPSLVLPRYVVALSHQQDLVHQWTADPQGTVRQLLARCVDFERHAPGDPLMLVATAYGCVMRGERDEALLRLETALELDPNAVRAHSLYGQVLAMRGHADQALHELELARLLSPRDPARWTVLAGTALAHFVAERYVEAVGFAKHALLERSDAPFTYGVLAAAQAQAGDGEAAKRTVQALRQRGGKLSAGAVAMITSCTEPAIAERFIAGLQMAGIESGR